MSTVDVGHRAGAVWWLALFGVLGALMGARAGAGAPPLVLEPLPDWPGTSDVAAAAPGGRAPVPLAEPVEVAVPALDLRAPVRPVGLDAAGALVTPPAQETGWYRHGAVPGARGSAVIVGHVDSATAPGVFAELAGLEPGDLVGVRDAHGVWSVFRVTELTRHPKAALPREFWAPGNDRLLRLITCGGTFDARSGHYRDNVVAHTVALGRWHPPPAAPDAAPPWERIGR